MNRRSLASSSLRLVAAAIAVLGAGITVAQGATGPTSKLYVDTSNFGSLYTIQGTNVIAGPAATYCSHCESAIAVDGDIRSLGTIAAGGQYNLDLTKTGATYATSTLGFQDGTTDGRHNYAATASFNSDHTYVGIDVYAFGRDWSNPSVVFNIDTQNFISGITYDPTNNSMWVVSSDGNDNSVFQDFSLAGALLSSFSESTIFANGLALDYADGTLWTIQGPGTAFYQFSKTGQALQHISYREVAGGLSTVGIEFDLAGDARTTPNGVPEPDLAALLGIGVVGWCTTRKRFARSTRGPMPA